MTNSYKKFLLSTLALCYFFSSCKKADDLGITRININNKDIAYEADISSIIDSVQVIPLTESPGNYLTDIFKIIAVRNKFIAFDYVHAHKINLYDGSGHFVKNIIKSGEDKADAFQLNDCWLNNKNELEVWDFAAKKIYHFDSLYNLRHVVKSAQPYIFNNIAAIPNSDGYIGFANYRVLNKPIKDKYFGLAFLDSALNPIGTELNYDKALRGVNWLTFANQFQTYKDSLRFFRSYDNYIYNITKDSFKKRYKLVYVNNPLPDDLMATTVTKHIADFRDGRKVATGETGRKYFSKLAFFWGEWMETNRYILFNSVNTDEHVFFCVVDKSKQYQVTHIGSNLMVKGKYNMALPEFNYYDPGSNCLVASLDGFHLVRLLDKNSIFKDVVQDDPGKIYIIKVKLKR